MRFMPYEIYRYIEIFRQWVFSNKSTVWLSVVIMTKTPSGPTSGTTKERKQIFFGCNTFITKPIHENIMYKRNESSTVGRTDILSVCTQTQLLVEITCRMDWDSLRSPWVTWPRDWCACKVASWCFSRRPERLELQARWRPEPRVQLQEDAMSGGSIKAMNNAWRNTHNFLFPGM